MFYFLNILSLFLIGSFFHYDSVAVAEPGQIIIIRHGEKPAKLPDGSELPGLSPAGEARAKALVGYLTQTPDLLKFGDPIAIYACPPPHKGGSTRPVDTVKPTADKLSLAVITNYKREKKDDIGKDQETSQSQMAKHILGKHAYRGKNVIICWEHHTIPDLIKSLGGPDIGEWGDVFNRTIVLTYDNGTVKLQDLTQPF